MAQHGPDTATEPEEPLIGGRLYPRFPLFLSFPAMH